MIEEWKEIYGFDVLYEVSNLGRVRTKYEKHKGYTNHYHDVIPTDNGNGYLRFNWRINGKQKTVYVHDLVASAFVDNPNGYVEVNHKDENKHNNNSDNLEWCTHKYNCRYGTRNERVGKKTSKRIICVETNKMYNSLREASKLCGISVTALSNCLNGRSKSCSGKTWKYV